MQTKLQYITLEVEGAVGILTLNLPDKLNGISGPMQAEIREVLADVQSKQRVRALIITGAGRAFCSGADLGGIRQQGDGRAQAQNTYEVMLEQSNPLILEMRRSSVPIVAAVNGIAAGAGASLALSADIVVAGLSASFLMPFVPALGIVPDLGSTWMLPRLFGDARARAALLLGDRISAQQAADWGGIWACVEDDQLMTVARQLAERLAAGPRHGAAELKAALEKSAGATLEEQLQYEAERQLELIAREEFQEGMNAFLEKRKPVFS